MDAEDPHENEERERAACDPHQQQEVGDEHNDDLLLSSPAQRRLSHQIGGDKRRFTEEKKRFLREKYDQKILKNKGNYSKLHLDDMEIKPNGDVYFKGDILYKADENQFKLNREFNYVFERAKGENTTPVEREIDNNEKQGNLRKFETELQQRIDKIRREHLLYEDLMGLTVEAEHKNTVEGLADVEKKLEAKKGWFDREKNRVVTECVEWVQDKADFLRGKKGELPKNKRNFDKLYGKGFFRRVFERLGLFGSVAGVVAVAASAYYYNTSLRVLRFAANGVHAAGNFLHEKLVLVQLSEQLQTVQQDQQNIEKDLDDQKELSERLHGVAIKDKFTTLKNEYNRAYKQFTNDMQKLSTDRERLHNLVRFLKLNAYRRELRKSELRQEVLDLKTDIENNYQASENKEKQWQRKLADFTQTQRDNAEYTKQILTLSRERAQNKATISALKEELDTKTKEWLSLVGGGMEAQQRDLDQEIRILKEKLALAEADLEEVAQKYKNPVSKVGQLERDFAASKTKVHELEKRLASEKNAVATQSLKNQHAVAIDEFVALGQKLSNLEHAAEMQLQQLTEKNIKLGQDVRRLETIRKEKSSRISDLEAEMQAVLTKLQDSKTTASEKQLLAEEKSSLQARHEQLQKDYENLKSESSNKIEQLVAENKALVNKANDLDSKVNMLRGEKSSLEKRFNSQQQRVYELESDLKAEQDDKKKAEQKLKEAKQKLNNYETELNEAAKNLEKVETTNENLQTLQTKNQELVNQVDELKRYKTAAITNMNVLEEQKKTLKSDLSTEIAAKQKEITEINAKLQISAEKLNSVHSKLKATESKLAKDLENALKTIKEKEKEIEKAKQAPAPGPGDPEPSRIYSWLQKAAKAGGRLGWLIAWILKILWRLSQWLLYLIYWLMKNVMTLTLFGIIALLALLVSKLKKWRT